jgi:hypothetical protein
VLSPFLFWRPDRARLASASLRLIAAVVVAASAAAGGTALWRDLRFAYTWAGPSIYAETDRRQMTAVRQTVSEGEVILLIAKPTDVWHARLWQRGLYPRNQVVVLFEPVGVNGIRRLRSRYGVRHAVLIGPPGFDPGFRWHRDLGPLAGLPDRVSFGELLP